MQWHYFKRLLLNYVGQGLALLATLFTLFWLVWLLTTLVGQGWQALDLSMFMKDTPAPGAEGGMMSMCSSWSAMIETVDDDIWLEITNTIYQIS